VKRTLATLFIMAAVIACGNAPDPNLGAPPAILPPVAKPPEPAASAQIPWQPTPDAPYRQTEPVAASTDLAFVPPKFERFKSHGVDVILSERHELPIVSLRLVVHAGAGESAKPWKYAALGQMLEQGTASRSALQISDRTWCVV
jgi:zinc protease